MTTHARAKPPKIIGLIIKEPMEWISVKDQIPDDGEYVIIYANPLENIEIDGPQIFVGYRYEKRWNSAWGDAWVPFSYEDITHWMPLPEPPNPRPD